MLGEEILPIIINNYLYKTRNTKKKYVEKINQVLDKLEKFKVVHIPGRTFIRIKKRPGTSWGSGDKYRNTKKIKNKNKNKNKEDSTEINGNDDNKEIDHYNNEKNNTHNNKPINTKKNNTKHIKKNDTIHTKKNHTKKNNTAHTKKNDIQINDINKQNAVVEQTNNPRKQPCLNALFKKINKKCLLENKIIVLKNDASSKHDEHDNNSDNHKISKT